MIRILTHPDDSPRVCKLTQRGHGRRRSLILRPTTIENVARDLFGVSLRHGSNLRKEDFAAFERASTHCWRGKHLVAAVALNLMPRLGEHEFVLSFSRSAEQLVMCACKKLRMRLRPYDAHKMIDPT